MLEEEVSLIYNGRSYRVCIPPSFIRNNHLRKGDRLRMILEDDRVIVEPKRKQNNGKSISIFSIGYEGKTIEAFTKILKTQGVKQLIDVRMNAFSYKKGFSKAPLSNALHQAGIMYAHIPQLGTDQDTRTEYRETGDISKLFNVFEKKLERDSDSYELLKALINYNTSAIMCFEDDHTQCHRSIIEKKLKNDNVSIIHLDNGKQNTII